MEGSTPEATHQLAARWFPHDLERVVIFLPDTSRVTCQTKKDPLLTLHNSISEATSKSISDRGPSTSNPCLYALDPKLSGITYAVRNVLYNKFMENVG